MCLDREEVIEIYIYIYIEREREKERDLYIEKQIERERERKRKESKRSKVYSHLFGNWPLPHSSIPWTPLITLRRISSYLEVKNHH